MFSFFFHFFFTAGRSIRHSGGCDGERVKIQCQVICKHIVRHHCVTAISTQSEHKADNYLQTYVEFV